MWLYNIKCRITNSIVKILKKKSQFRYVDYGFKHFFEGKAELK